VRSQESHNSSIPEIAAATGNTLLVALVPVEPTGIDSTARFQLLAGCPPGFFAAMPPLAVSFSCPGRSDDIYFHDS